MKKTILMLIGLGAVFAVSTACFGPSSKPIKGSPASDSSDSSRSSSATR